MSAPTDAAEIIYTGDGKELQESPAWLTYEGSNLHLFPGTKAAPLHSGNKVTINYNPSTSGVMNPEFIFGGLSESGNADSNCVVFLDGQVQGDILCGYSNSGNVTHSKVDISGGSINNSVLGGTSYKGNATNNTVNISDGVIGYEVVGGYSYEGDSERNTVTISGGSVADGVYGGRSYSSNVTGSAVTISGGSVADGVYGGYSYSSDVTGNIVAISGGSVNDRVYGGLSGSGGTATNNRITISGGSVAGDVLGGYSDSGKVAGNTVTISGGSMNRNVYGGFGFEDEVTGNVVIVSGGELEDVCGGVNHNQSGGSATNNSVTISGGSLGEKIYGGYSQSGDATGNTVTIIGRSGMERAQIRGGASFSKGDTLTGNTLNIKNSSISVRGIGNFEYYNFHQPKAHTTGEIMLRVMEKVNLKGTTVEIFLQDSTQLRKGDKIVLIHSTAGISDVPKNKSGKAQQDGLLYEFSIHTESNNLWAEVVTVSSVK